MGMDQMPKKPKPAPLDADIKYIKCDACPIKDNKVLGYISKGEYKQLAKYLEKQGANGTFGLAHVPMEECRWHQQLLLCYQRRSTNDDT